MHARPAMANVIDAIQTFADTANESGSEDTKLPKSKFSLNLGFCLTLGNFSDINSLGIAKSQRIFLKLGNRWW